MAFIHPAPCSTFTSSSRHVNNRKTALTQLQPVRSRSHSSSRSNASRIHRICCVSSSTTTADAANMTESDRKQQVLDVLSEVEDPDLHQNIVSLGFIKDIEFTSVQGISTVYDVSFKVELTTPACPVKETFQSDCQRLAESIPWVGKATVIMTAMQPGQANSLSSGSSAFEYVNSIVAVASCKGGVGKSTTAVNLAYSLSSQGARVGILDADIYGPSLPTLIQPEDREIQFKDGKIKPLVYKDVKLMSFGYINPDAAVMRGPMISSMLNQIATTTEWGVLDYLIIDMPPGTGDIQITLSQILNIDAAVIITTPQKLCFVDVIKGIDMFDKVSIPSIAVIENMSYFEIPHTDEKYYLFGKGHTDKLKNDYGILNSFQIPIDQEVGECSDIGRPYVDEKASSKIAGVFEQVSGCIAREVAKIKHGGLSAPKIEFNEDDGLIHINGDEQTIHPIELRAVCRCAICVDEMTGRVRLKRESIPEDIHPKVMRAVGNYAIEMVWSDGHPSLYPYSRFVDRWDSEQSKRKSSSSSSSSSSTSLSEEGGEVELKEEEEEAEESETESSSENCSCC